MTHFERVLVAACVVVACACGASGQSPEGPTVEGHGAAATSGDASTLVTGDNPVADLPALRPPRERASKEELDTFIASVVERRQRLAAPAGDLDVFAASLPAEVAPLFELVRDRVAFVPYAGVLGGARGALQSGAGNATDQSLLLSELLRRKGFRTRLAEAGEGALAVAVPTRVVPAGRAAAVGPLVAEVVSERDRLWSALAGAALPTAHKAPGRHVWVQVEQAGGWVDLDPSVAGARVGQAHAPVAATHDEPPTGWHHRVTIRVLVEQLADGRLREHEVLRVSRTTEELNGAALTFTNMADVEGEATDGSADRATAFMPVLLVDGEPLMDRGFDLDGNPVAKAAFGNPIAKATTGAAGLLGELDVGASAPAAKNQLAAEWLEITISSPGMQARTHRRAVLDRVDAGSRSGSPTIDPSQQDLRALRLSLRGFDNFLVRPALTCGAATADAFLEELQGWAEIRSNPQAKGRHAPSAELLVLECTLQRAADELTTKALAGGRYYRASPAVLRRTMRLERQGSSVSLVAGFDIIESQFAVHHQDATQAARHALALGIAQTAVEHVVEKELSAVVAKLAAPNAPWADVAATGSAWQSLRGQKLVPVAKPSDLAATRASLASKARMQRALAEGWLVVASVDGDGWWRIDPSSGTALGIDAEGHGGATEQVTLLDKIAIRVHLAILNYGKYLQHPIVAAALCLASTTAEYFVGDGLGELVGDLLGNFCKFDTI